MDSSTHLSEKAKTYLHKLCLEIPTRRVGSVGNRTATDFFARAVASYGFATEAPRFDCIDWSDDGAQLTAGGDAFEAFAGPYSLGCQVRAPLVIASTVEGLEAIDAADRIVLLVGDLVKEQLMPKNFPYYNPDGHQRIIALLETKRPAAIIAATTRDPGMAGAMYPFPLIEDGDFDIPSAFMTDVEGSRLAGHEGEEVALEIRAERHPSWGCNVVARKGTDPGRRAVLFAHIDSKDGTPGAIDNGTGVVVLLLLAELLTDYDGDLGVEIVALNGEDYYSAPGEQLWVSQNEGRFGEIVLGINLDGAGYYGGPTAYSLYDCLPEVANGIHAAFTARPDMVEGDPWYQSDHSLFIMNQRPALAITSGQFAALWTEIAHTTGDRPEIVEPSKLVDIALALRDLLLYLDRLPV